MAVQRVAVLTSGGDAPGMNAAIRAVVRTGVARGAEMFGVEHGYTGLMSNSLIRLGARDVGGIIQRGGTMLGTTRCIELKTEQGLEKAVSTLRKHGITGLVVIGGNGSQSGASALSNKGIAVIGVASTIDNDLYGTDITIGATTAADIAVEAIDRLRVTAASHQRAFLVEVMGRQCGFLALMAGIAGGAEAILIPEVETTPEAVAQDLCEARERGKSHAIVVVAEGARYNAASLDEYFKAHGQRLGFDLRVSLLGHIQRGGSPGVFDRMIATRMGAAATEQLLSGHHGVLVGIIGGKIATTPLADVAGRSRPVDPQWIELARVLAV